jgi:hypothetical protein
LKPDRSEEAAWDRAIAPWWAKFALGAVFLFMAVDSFVQYGRVESGQKRAPKIVSRSEQVLYELGGKWLVSGLIGLIAAAFLTWGVVQLARGPAGASQVRTLKPRPAPGTPGYLPSLMVAFREPALLVSAVLHMLLAGFIVKSCFKDPVEAAYAVGVLIAVPVAYFEQQLLYRLLKWEDEPVFSPLTRAHVLMTAGYVVCMAVAVTLTLYESRERSAVARYEQERQREQEERHAIMNSPDVQRGMELLEKIRQKKRGEQPEGDDDGGH